MQIQKPDQLSLQAIGIHRHKGHGRPILEKTLFNWDAQDRYGELTNFEMGIKTF